MAKMENGEWRMGWVQMNQKGIVMVKKKMRCEKKQREK